MPKTKANSMDSADGLASKNTMEPGHAISWGNLTKKQECDENNTRETKNEIEEKSESERDIGVTGENGNKQMESIISNEKEKSIESVEEDDLSELSDKREMKASGCLIGMDDDSDKEMSDCEEENEGRDNDGLRCDEGKNMLNDDKEGYVPDKMRENDVEKLKKQKSSKSGEERSKRKKSNKAIIRNEKMNKKKRKGQEDGRMIAKGGKGKQSIKEKRKFRWHPGTQSLREIRKLQRSVEAIIPKKSFSRVVRSILTDIWGDMRIYRGDMRITKNAMEALQEAAEDHVVKTLRKSYLVTITRGGETLKEKDMKCFKAMCEEN